MIVNDVFNNALLRVLCAFAPSAIIFRALDKWRIVLLPLLPLVQLDLRLHRRPEAVGNGDHHGAVKSEQRELMQLV